MQQPLYRTVCEQPVWPWPLWDVEMLQAPLLTIGSCFSDRVGQRMQQVGMPVLQNPYGVVFNPASLCQQLLASAEDLCRHTVQTAEGWRSYHLHSRWVAATEEELLGKVAQQVQVRDEALAQSKYMVMTLGTASSWYLKEEDVLVANCQKQPAALFQKRLLTPEQVVAAIETVLLHYPEIRIILSVSPVRHTRETLQGNQVSKSILLYAAYLLREKHPDRVFYFPAYELVIDDLRDYRFYEADMVHPTPVAVQHVWNYFVNTVASPALQAHFRAVETTAIAQGHIPILPTP